MKLFVRIMVLAMAVLFGLQVLPWSWATMVVPGTSPLVALGSALSAREIVFPVALAVPLLLLALAKGRWFCRCLCPMGFVLVLVGKLKFPGQIPLEKVPAIGGWLVAIVLGSATAGYAWFLWMDPLVLFNGFCGVWRHKPLAWIDIVPAAGFCLVIILTLFSSYAWCERCCPLGALQAFLGRCGQWGRRAIFRVQMPSAIDQGLANCPGPVYSEKAMLLGRRSVLALLGGVGLAWLTRRVRKGNDVLPIRPPGAVDEIRFPGLCVRCGNCMTVCPQRIITPDLGNSGITGVLTPVVDFERDYCDEWCNRCTQVCPSGAIQRLTLDRKRMLVMGNALIEKDRCLAWSYQQNCMVCSEFCPYLAIRVQENKGVPCPEVNQEICRGCGACQNHCPALPLKAIIVHGLAQHAVCG